MNSPKSPAKEKKLKPQPYYPNYSANFIAHRHYRLMSLEERGLLWSMYNDYWVNRYLPNNPQDLAKYLGFDSTIIERALTDKVLHFFAIDGKGLKCPELDDYLQNIETKRNAQSDGGKLGAERKKGKNAKGEPKGIPEGQPEGSLNQFNSTQINSIQLINKGELLEHEEWMNEYENSTPILSEYEKQSNGH